MVCSGEMDLPSRDSGHGIHHPVYGAKLKEKSDQVGHECHLVILGYSESEKYSDGNDFLFQMRLSKSRCGFSSIRIPQLRSPGNILKLAYN